uniref:Dynein heavy chain tail domain-containing protein n=1 Tax=Strix occidentalis caurina TaxID=311401 RepID=A0A8D0EHN6_STROC
MPDLPLAKAEPISDSGCTSAMMYLIKKGNLGEGVVREIPMRTLRSVEERRGGVHWSRDSPAARGELPTLAVATGWSQSGASPGQVTDTVIVPILTNQKNHQGWPRVVSQDIIRHVHSLKSTVFMVVGQVRGKTLLPLPAGSEGIEDIDLENEKSLELIDKSLVHATESAIIDWSYQIQGVLKKESSEPLLQGSNPNPKVELEFWKNRCDDLECIYNQLRTKKVRNMMEMLEKVESSYVPAFKDMLMDVEAGEMLRQLPHSADFCVMQIHLGFVHSLVFLTASSVWL